MSSLRQQQANRDNAQLSTGPRTPEGKARSSMNALKTGLTATTVVLANESLDRFQQLLAAMVDTYRPQSVDELHCIEEIAAARWATRRAWTVEAAITDVTMDSQAAAAPDAPTADPPLRLAQAVQNLADNSRVLHEVHRRLSRSARLFDRAYAHLRKLQQDRGRQPAPGEENIQIEPNSSATREAA